MAVSENVSLSQGRQRPLLALDGRLVRTETVYVIVDVPRTVPLLSIMKLSIKPTGGGTSVSTHLPKSRTIISLQPLQ